METKINWESAVQTEILKRDNWAAHFLERIFGITGYLLTDATSLRDFQDSNEIEGIRQKTFKTYGYPLQKHHFSMPLWRLLDELERHRINARSKMGAPRIEVLQRELAFEYFLDHVLEVETIYLTDAFSLGNFVNIDDLLSTEIVDERTYRVYGTRLTSAHYKMPFWKLLDELEENCLGSELKE